MRRATGTLASTLALLALLLCSAPGAATAAAPQHGDGDGFALIGRTVLAAIGSAGADDAVDTLENSLALLGARYRVESPAANEASEPEPKPAAPPLSEEVVSDPSELPPASAGSNGSHVPRASSLRDEELFAHTRAAAEDGSTAILLTGIALAPPNAPEAVKGAINAANTIVGRPYVWGGGHGSWYSSGYDCSGSVSFALFGGGLIPRPLTSGDLMRWGAPGPGKWITVYANPGHVYAEIAGLRWDTVGDENGTGPRWHLATASGSGFAVRHPPGL